MNMEINKKQKIILYVVTGIIVFMLFFPPLYVRGENGASFNCGYSFIVSHYNDSNNGGCRVDATTLLIQWVGVLIAGGLAFFAVKGKKD